MIFLIESEIRKLDSSRKTLVETFKDYWGIDWEQSGVPMEEVMEIRARRDLWVHNQGKVNNQYLTMVGKQTSLEL